jgi:hypothetical protein
MKLTNLLVIISLLGTSALFSASSHTAVQPLYIDEGGEISFNPQSRLPHLSSKQVDPHTVNSKDPFGYTVLMHALRRQWDRSYASFGKLEVPHKEFTALLQLGANPLLPIKDCKDHFEYYRRSINRKPSDPVYGDPIAESYRMVELYLGIALHIIENNPHLPRETVQEILQDVEKWKVRFYRAEVWLLKRSHDSYKKLIERAIKIYRGEEILV